MNTDRELLELAAKAAGYELDEDGDRLDERESGGAPKRWNPLTDDGDRYRLARQLGLTIDFTDCTVWKRLSDHSLIQEYWGGDCGDEGHAVLRAAAEIGRAMLGAPPANVRSTG